MASTFRDFLSVNERYDYNTDLMIRDFAKVDSLRSLDFDPLLAMLQKQIGVKTGDAAGQFWSDIENSDWKRMSTSKREEVIKDYIEFEREFGDIS